MANLKSLGIGSRIYVGDHYTLIHPKYISNGPHGFREDFLKVFPIVSLWKLLTHGTWPVWTTGDRLAGFM